MPCRYKERREVQQRAWSAIKGIYIGVDEMGAEQQHGQHKTPLVFRGATKGPSRGKQVMPPVEKRDFIF